MIAQQSPSYSETDNIGLFSLWIQIPLIILAIISSLISLLIPILYFIRGKCKDHPTPLIAIISLLQALSNYNVILIAINIYNFEEFISITKIFDIFVFYERQITSQSSLCDFNFIIYIVLEMLSIAYNVCFSVDLLLTIKSPFFSGKKRMKYYHIMSALFLCITIPLSIFQTQQICDNEFHNRSIYKIPIVFMISLLVFYATSLAIIVYSYRTPQNTEIRKVYIKHHRIILAFLVIVWAFPLAANILLLFDNYDPNVFKILNIASFVSLVISGGLINIVRFCTDHYLWLQVKKMILEFKYFDQSQHTNQQDEETSTFISKFQKNTEDEHDVWNLPLANAVSTFHYQTVVTNIIQIVTETCADSEEQVFNSSFMKKKSEIKKQNLQSVSEVSNDRRRKLQQSDIKFENLNYQFNGPTLSAQEINQNLRYGNFQQIKRITKINKKLDMVAVQISEGGGDIDFNQKSVFRSVQYYESYSSKKNAKSPKNILNQKNLQIQTITIKVKSFAHPIFTMLRKRDGLTSERIKKTLDIGLNAQNIKKARQSLGASGSFFFFSYDNKLVIKTIAESQTKVFIKILPSYYEHVTKNPQSLLCRTYGLFSAQIAGISKINFIMLQNTFEYFQNADRKYRKYDLKGSTIKRQVKNPNAEVFKDINFLKSDEAFLLLPDSEKKLLFEQIKSDITLLSNHNIMDYSLLLGICNAPSLHKKQFIKKSKTIQAPLSPSRKQKNQKDYKIDENNKSEVFQNHWRNFTDSALSANNRIYSISLIDYLQEFNFNKYAELTLKKLFKGGGDISSIDTEAYYKRFLAFTDRILVSIEQ